MGLLYYTRLDYTILDYTKLYYTILRLTRNGMDDFFLYVDISVRTIKGASVPVEISGFGNRWRFPKSMGGPQIIH